MGLIRRELVLGLLSLQLQAERSHLQRAVERHVDTEEQAELSGMICGLEAAVSIVEIVEESQR